MPRYDTTDFRFNSRELDPCLAAELRLKKNAYNRSWLLGCALLTFFLALFGLAIFFGLTYFNSKGQYEGQLPDATSPNTPPSDSVTSDSTLPPTLPPTRPTQRNSYVWTQPQTPWIPPKTTTESTTTKATTTSSSSTTTTTTTSTTTASTTTTTTGRPSIDPVIVYEQMITRRTSTTTEKAPTLVPIRQEFQTCEDYRVNGITKSGVYKLTLPRIGQFYAFCQMEPHESWMVMHRRQDDKLEFWNRTMADYEMGFGDPSGNHWIGLSRVRALIDAGHRLRLRIRIDGDRCSPKTDSLLFVADYDFSIGQAADGYRLNATIVNQNFTEPDILVKENGGRFFVATDPQSCLATKRMGGFWLLDERKCTDFAPNGEYNCERKGKEYGAFIVGRHYYNNGNAFRRTRSKFQSIQMLLRTCPSDGC
ncbi:hypothetical protein M3Y94_00656700 [Aphelenchoides besseyi]|nr:hypothetical protein M3Y94_00656700 [Aphelenchoides besseyi]KAI6231189.1 hypothetical protein M3Y95_00355200 [Aphelenchoides besseyi]